MKQKSERALSKKEDIGMLTNQRLLELVLDAATCYFPTDELSKEQLERFDKITIHWCNCVLCKDYFVGNSKIKSSAAGHVNRATCRISISKYMQKKGFECTPSIFLLDLISTTVHEIVHILYPEFNEEQTHVETFRLLKKNQWLIEENEILRKKKDVYVEK